MLFHSGLVCREIYEILQLVLYVESLFYVLVGVGELLVLM